MKTLRKGLLSSIALLFASSTLLYSFGLDAGIIANNDDDSNAETPLSLILYPSFSLGKADIELRLPLDIEFDDGISFNWDRYDSLEQGDLSNYEYYALNASHYAGFINYINYGKPTEDFHFHYGKLINATLNDGALVDDYTDDSIGLYYNRGGLAGELNGSAFNFGHLGGEIISDDILAPTLLGYRGYIKPLFRSENPLLKNIEIGYSQLNTKGYTHDDAQEVIANSGDSDATANPANDDTKEAQQDILNDNDTLFTEGSTFIDYSLDITAPLFKKKGTSLNLYYDVISKISNDYDTDYERLIYDDSTREISWRVGTNGWIFDALQYNMHIETIVEDDANNNNDFGDDITDMICNVSIPTMNDTYKIGGNVGYTTTDGRTYIKAKALSTFTDGEWSDYSMKASLALNRQIALFKDFTASYEKSYPGMDEDFYEGLGTLRNTEIKLSCGIVYHMQVITVGVIIDNDNDADSDIEYSLGYKLALL